jgi:hypothetical protein
MAKAKMTGCKKSCAAPKKTAKSAKATKKKAKK